MTGRRRFCRVLPLNQAPTSPQMTVPRRFFPGVLRYPCPLVLGGTKPGAAKLSPRFFAQPSVRVSRHEPFPPAPQLVVVFSARKVVIVSTDRPSRTLTLTLTRVGKGGARVWLTTGHRCRISCRISSFPFKVLSVSAPFECKREARLWNARTHRPTNPDQVAFFPTGRSSSRLSEKLRCGYKGLTTVERCF